MLNEMFQRSFFFFFLNFHSFFCCSLLISNGFFFFVIFLILNHFIDEFSTNVGFHTDEPVPRVGVQTMAILSLPY